MAIDPDVQTLMDALEARIAALEGQNVAAVHPDSVIEKYPDGTEITYRKE